MHAISTLPNRQWRWLWAIPLAACLGCPAGAVKLNTAKGKLTHNGKPATGAVVTLHPTSGTNIRTVLPTGLVKEDGTFSLTTGQSEGAPVGEYKVTITWFQEIGGAAPGKISMTPPETKDRLNGAYVNAEASKITVSIKSGDNNLDPIDLK